MSSPIWVCTLNAILANTNIPRNTALNFHLSNRRNKEIKTNNVVKPLANQCNLKPPIDGAIFPTMSNKGVMAHSNNIQICNIDITLAGFLLAI